MATYISLFKFGSSFGEGDGGVKGMIEGGAPESHKLIESHGGKLIEVYLTMGQYDGALIVEFPDDISATRAALAMRAFGGSTETMRAYPEKEWSKIAKGL